MSTIKVLCDEVFKYNFLFLCTLMDTLTPPPPTKGRW